MRKNLMSDITKLQEFDFVVGGDFSASTLRNDCPGDLTRNAYMKETAFGFAHSLSKIDSDGLGVVIGKGMSPVVKDGASANDVAELFDTEPGGSTPMHLWLQAAFNLAGKSEKKDFIVFFFDGEPDDKAAVKKVIIDQANSQANDDDLTLLLVQIGNDAGAGAFLKELDDNLSDALGNKPKFDIVDTCTMEQLMAAGSAAEVVLKAIAD
jgi:hypothetical protein